MQVGPSGVLDLVFRTLPLWLVGLLLVAACVLAREAGILLYRRLRARSPQAPEPETSNAESHVIAAVFALLAFVVGISFSIALDRYDSRRGLVAEEVNAIRTSYLRASLFDEPHSSRLQTTMRQYAHTRIAPGGIWDARMDAQLMHSRALRIRLWNETRAAVLPVRESDQASYFLEAINEVLNVGARRELAGRAHIPTRIVAILFLYLIAASAVLGYLLGDRPGLRRLATTALIALFAVMILTVLDIDRPQAGAVRVPQQALEELVVTLDADEPPRVAAPRS